MNQTRIVKRTLSDKVLSRRKSFTSTELADWITDNPELFYDAVSKSIAPKSVVIDLLESIIAIKQNLVKMDPHDKLNLKQDVAFLTMILNSIHNFTDPSEKKKSKSKKRSK